ncbi:hypothetical protein HF086_006856 [Spodoptera exigua]|uniref:Glutaredoxin domain-containing protein n=1 Tax=Spodoptera exigua TaxID=7107 RepID=A0A922MAS0_SPOEX|nr:hypothetical protein HF086_006856 [Spodoptera exigua]
MGSLASKITHSSKMASSQEIQQFIKQAISQDKVVVFSKSYCPYCTMAKEVFSKVKQPIKVYELDERDDGTAIQENLAAITGFRTVSCLTTASFIFITNYFYYLHFKRPAN